MFDLALEMGTTPAALARSMLEEDFIELQHYAARRMLPQRRLELYLARIAMLIAQTAGGVKDAQLSDFLFDPDDEKEGEDDGSDAREFFGFKPRN